MGRRNPEWMYSTLTRRTPLKVGARLKPISDKQRQKQVTWRGITDQKAITLHHLCQWCGKYMGLNYTGHHIIKKSRGRIDTYENCYVCHWLPCHLFIEDNNVDVRIHPNKQIWEADQNSKQEIA